MNRSGSAKQVGSVGRIDAPIPHSGIAEGNVPVRMMAMNERPATVFVDPKPPVRIPCSFRTLAVPIAGITPPPLSTRAPFG